MEYFQFHERRSWENRPTMGILTFIRLVRVGECMRSVYFCAYAWLRMQKRERAIRSVPRGKLQWQSRPLTARWGYGGLPWPPPPCGSDFRSCIQEVVMTTTRPQTISLPLNCLFHCCLTWQFRRLRKSGVSRVSVCPMIVVRLEKYLVVSGAIQVWPLRF